MAKKFPCIYKHIFPLLPLPTYLNRINASGDHDQASLLLLNQLSDMVDAVGKMLRLLCGDVGLTSSLKRKTKFSRRILTESM